MPLPANSKQRFLFLDSIRALAALYVLMHHAVQQYYLVDTDHLAGIEKYVVKLFSDGHQAVDLFIVLSGFSLMLAVTKNNYTLKGGNTLFFKRRILRIVPPYYATLLFSLLLTALLIGRKTGTLWDISIPVTRNDIISHFLFVHDILLSTSSKISYSLWSISVECRLYLFFPVLIWFWRKIGSWAALSFSVFITILFSFILLAFKDQYTDINLLRPGISPYIILFSFGMLAADLSFSKNNMASVIRSFYSKLSPAMVIIIFAALLIIYKLVPQFVKINSLDGKDITFIRDEIKYLLFGFISALLLFVCAVASQNSKQTIILRFLSWRPLVFVGIFSYSLYLIHPPLLQLISQYLLVPFHLSLFAKTCLLLVLGTPPILMISYAFFLIFERPFLLAGKKDATIVDAEVTAAQNPAP